MMASFGIFCLRCLAFWPLWALRAMGWGFGQLLYVLAVSRRRVALRNLQLCFPKMSAAQRSALTRRHFVRFAQSWLDRAWLWHGLESTVRVRLRLTGAVSVLENDDPVVLFAPHFVGMDAGWTALTLLIPRQFETIYTHHQNKRVNHWVKQRRQRFGQARLFERADGIKNLLSGVRAGHPLYLLPDMNFGPEESIFVPFYGQLAATVPSLSRFARLGRAKVMPVITRMTPYGYEVQVLPAWADYPGVDQQADTALMNLRLQAWIDAMPEQYYWVHKRFKTRPPGEPSVYSA